MPRSFVFLFFLCAEGGLGEMARKKKEKANPRVFPRTGAAYPTHLLSGLSYCIRNCGDIDACEWHFHKHFIHLKYACGHRSEKAVLRVVYEPL